MTKLSDVNTTSIRDAITLGCRTMHRIFNADDGDTPFFLTHTLPETYLAYCGDFSEAHVPGRHLNALLRAESVLGVEVEEGCIEKHARVLWRTFSGPVALPLSRPQIGGTQIHFLPHNCREAFFALFALARYRQSERAVETAKQYIRAIRGFWSPDRGWDARRLTEDHGVDFREDSTVTIWGLGRSIGPLVDLYRATGLDEAIELAQTLADAVVAESFPEDGAFAVERMNPHMHSITCTLSGLAALGEMKEDLGLLRRVQAFYENGLRSVRDDLGWSIEGLRGDSFGVPDMGEANNTGDMLETALSLGRLGLTDGFADGELMLRGHLLPSQLRDVSFVPDPANPEGKDGLREVAQRIQGAWGFPAPYGHAPLGLKPIMFHMDVVGGVVSSLCHAYENIIRREGTWRRVELLFDHQAEGMELRSPYTHDGVLSIRLREAGAVAVRIPQWVPEGELKVDGQVQVPVQGYLKLDDPKLDEWIRIEFPLVERSLRLRHRTHDIRVRLRGDAVVAMENFGAELTFFEAWT